MYDADMKRTELIAIRVTPDEFYAIRGHAEKAERTVSDFVRRALQTLYMPPKTKPKRKARP
jgi:uncharacterized protein (DUF1778 family)